MAFKMRSGNKTPFKLMGAKDVPMKMMKKSPSKMMKKSPAEFNPGLRKAAADGKLDNNPKFKAAVENAPAKMMKKSAAKLMKKDSAAKLMKKDSASKMMKKDSAAKLMKRPKDKKSPGEDRVKDIKKTNKAGVGTGKGLKVDKKNRKKSPAKKMDVIEEFADKDFELNRGTGKQAVHKSFEKSIMADIEGKKPKMYQYTGPDKEYVDSDAGKQKYFEMRKRLDKKFRKKTKGFKSVKDYNKSRDEAAKNRESATKMMKKSGAKMMKKSGTKMMKKSAAKMMKKDGPKDVKMGPKKKTSPAEEIRRESKIAKGKKPRSRGGLKVPSKVKNASPMKAGQTAGQIVKRERMMT